MTPLDHPAAWKAEELFDRPEWQLTISRAERYELLASAGARILSQQPLERTEELPGLPAWREKIHFIREALEEGAGAVRLVGFPADVTLELAQHAFWILCQALGTPVSQSAQGERLLSVRDAGFAEGDARARGPNTRKRLRFHTDRCDVIGFLCYRQAQSGGENQVVSSLTLYHEMLRSRPDLAAVLSEPYLYQRHNVDTGNALPYVEQPIFSFCDGHFAANLLRVLIDRAYAMPETPDMTSLQREALDFLEDLAAKESLHATFRQAEGDMLFLNNFVTFHRRSEFVDWEDPERKRHLLRIWLSMPNSRPLDPRFAGNYGATAAGAIRGGMHPPRTDP